MAALLAIFLVSAAALSYEIFLIRLLSVRFWPHFVPLIVSQAMLGFGAAGVGALLLRSRIAKAPESVFAGLVLLSPLAFDAAFRASQIVPFDPFLLMWEPSSWPAFCAFFALLSIPFALAGGAVAVPLSFGMGRPGPVYAASLGGSAAGAVLALPVFSLVSTASLLRVPVALCLLSGVFLLRPPGERPSKRRAALFAASLLLLVLPPAAPALSPYKDMAVARALPEARTIAARHGPSGDYEAVTAPGLHIAPGLSFTFTGEIPRQAAVHVDAEFRGVVVESGGAAVPDYLRYFPAALPFKLVRNPSVLQFGLRGTEGVLFAAANGASSVTVVEPAKEYADLILRDMAPFSGGWPRAVHVDVRVEGSRNFLSRDESRFDIVELSEISSGSFSSLGVHAAGETFLLTREGVRATFSALRPDGMLAVTGGLKTPPRESVKILATIRDELVRARSSPAGTRILVARGWGSFAVAARLRAYSPDEVARAQRFCDDMGFVLVWPSPAGAQAGRAGDPFADAVRATLAESGEGPARPLFDLRPATDDSPYFYRFLRPAMLPEFRRLLGHQWVPFVEWGVMFLLLSFAVSLLPAALLLVLPPMLVRGGRGTGSVPLALYFSALGLSYMLLELTFLKAGILILGDTIRAATAAIGGFALFSGLGSAYSRKWESPATMRRRVFPGIAVLALSGFLGLTAAAPVLLAHGRAWQVAAFLAALAPCAFLMGMPFPAAVSRLSPGNAPAIPLAWGINGFFSVTGASLASVAALWIGFRLTVLAACLLYLLAGALFDRLPVGECVIQTESNGAARNPNVTPAHGGTCS